MPTETAPGAALTLTTSEEEALFNAAEVLSAMLAWRLDQSKDVPAPSK